MVRSKNRSLPALDGLLLVVMLMAGLAALLSLLDTVTSKAVADLTIGLTDPQLARSLPPEVVLDGADAVVSVRTGLAYRLAWWFTGPAASLLAAAGAYILRDIVRTARDGDPFVAPNVRRLRILGGLAVGYFVLTVAQSFVGFAIQADLDLDEVSVSLSFLPVVAAVVFFALAEIWQRGVDMRDDQQLTV